MNKLEHLFGAKLNLSGNLTQEEVLKEIEKGLKHYLKIIKSKSVLSEYGYAYKNGQLDNIENVLAYLEDAIT